jgi:hypothetical protein
MFKLVFVSSLYPDEAELCQNCKQKVCTPCPESCSICGDLHEEGMCQD